MKRPEGRPTKYNNDRVNQVSSYLSDCKENRKTIPTIEGLAEYMFVNVDTINEWRDRHPEFSVAIKAILEKQKNKLMIDGLYGGKEVNATMAIFLLKANHGMMETEKKVLAQEGVFNVNIDGLIGLSKTTGKTEDSSPETI